MMKLRTKVKVAEVNNLSDARYCAGMGVDYMGFVMKHTSKTVLPKENYLAITGWLEGVQFVGEFWGATDMEINEAYEAFNFSFIQSDSIEQCKRLSEKGLKVIFSTDELLEESYSFLDYVVLETKNKPSVNQLKEQASLNSILLGGDVGLGDLDVLISDVQVAGIQIKGGEEIRPGYKDFDELADILEELEVN